MNLKKIVWTCLACVVSGGATKAGEVSTAFFVEANGGGGRSAGWGIILILGRMRLFGRRGRLLPEVPKGTE